MADVEVVATHELATSTGPGLETLLHRIFGAARLDIEIKDRLGQPVIPRQWFLFPLSVVDEAIEKIRDGTIADYLRPEDCLAHAHSGIEISVPLPPIPSIH